MHHEDCRQLLIVRYGPIGNTILTLPLFEPIRRAFPRARIILAGDPLFYPLLYDFPLIDEFRVFDRRGKFLQQLQFINGLRKCRPELALVFNTTARAALIAWLSGAKVRIGHNTENRGFLLSHPVPVPAAPGMPYILQYLPIVEKAGVRVEEFKPPRLPVHEEAAAKVRDLLGTMEPMAVIHPGASKKAKIWPAEKFVAVATHLSRRHGMRAILVGGPEERALGDCVLAGIENGGGTGLNLAGRLNLAELAELFRLTDLVVANDSGPMHLAGLIDRPLVGLFTSDVNTWRPLGSRMHLVSARGNDIIAIEVDQVLDACDRLLDAGN